MFFIDGCNLFEIGLFVLFLCWGSFLNVVAYRLTYNKPFFTMRSYCPMCQTMIAWYDNIPLLSWLILRGRCRSCKKSISYLYPLIELLSGVIFTVLFFFLQSGPLDIFFMLRFWSYFIFFSALLVGVRTDLQAMVIPQLVTLWMIPLGIVSSLVGALRIVVVESLLGAVLGYGVLWLVGFLFKRATKKDGIGVGDMELLGMIGAFLGPIGVWCSLLIGSMLGLVLGGSYIIAGSKGRNTRIPFGPFLAFGATVYFFFQSFIVFFLLG